MAETIDFNNNLLNEVVEKNLKETLLDENQTIRQQDSDINKSGAAGGLIAGAGRDSRNDKDPELGEDNKKSTTSFTGRYVIVNEEECGSANRGFYYDSQLHDPYLSVTLHANTQPLDLENNEWQPWQGECLEPMSSSVWSGRYGKEPLARSIMSEDFAYSVSNNFSDYNAGNPIEDIFEKFKPYAPLIQKFGDGLEKGVKEVKEEGNFASSWVSGLQSLIEDWGVSSFLKKTSDYLNKALYVQGTRFSYYNGTSFNFNNLEMKFTIFSDFVKVNGRWEFQSVEDYLSKIRPYVMGKYDPLDLEKDKKKAEEVKKGIGEKFFETIKDYIGFQSPPGGFKMDTKNLDNCLEGTVRLNIGSTWAIENLVIKNMNVVMSRVQAKHPFYYGQTIPLYAEVNLQLAPASATVDTGYSKIMSHRGLINTRSGIATAYYKEMERLKNEITGKK